MTTRKSEIVVDTNVPVVANGQASQASFSCRRECTARLRQIVDRFRVLLDNQNLVLTEYKGQLNFGGQPEAGDAFFKWLHDNQANPEHCRKVNVNLHPDRGFKEFPNDPNLSSFDFSDRKFVAVALASGTGPDVLNASDTDWWDHRHELQQHGVNVVFLCQELMTP